MTTGEKIKEFRIKKGLSQVQLASEIGCTSQVVSNIERSYCGVNAVLLGKIAEALNVPVSTLINPEEDSKIHLTKDEFSFIQRYRKLLPNEQKMLQAMMETFLAAQEEEDAGV